MSKKKKPFDAALFALRQTLQSHGCTRRLWERIQGYTGVEDGDIIKIKAKMNDIRIAIRVLKAAGKMDKQECLEVFNLFMENTKMGQYDDIRYRKDGLAIFPISQIRGLLEALPEKEEK